MTISTCVQGLLAEGRISKGTAAEAERLYQKNFNVLKHSMGIMAAATEASERTIKTLELAHLRKKRNALLQVKAQNDWLKDMQAKAGSDENGRPNPLRREDAFEAMRQMDFHRQGIERQAHGMMEGILAKHRRNLLGEVRAKSDLDNVVDELHGRSTGDLNAKELAESWERTAEWLRSRFNAAGGNIAKLEGWALPQSHDSRAIREAGRKAWKAEVLPLLDRPKMIDWETGLPMADDRLDEMLDDMWRAITTDGWSRRDAGSMGAAALANRYQDSRVLHFAGPDAWRAYSAKFGGKATPLDAMLAHVRRMSRDIAAMERMGPNPRATLNWQQDWLEKSGAEWLASEDPLPPQTAFQRLYHGTWGQKIEANVKGGQGKLERLFNEYSGHANLSENPRLSIIFGAVQAQQVAAKLGSAFLSSGGDIGNMMARARANDLPAAKTLQRYAKMMAPGSEEDRRLAARLGIVSEEWTRSIVGMDRLNAEEFTHELTRRISDVVMKASLLSRHTESAQMAFGMELMNAITMQRGKAFGELDKGFAAMLGRYGLNAERWDKLRATPVRMERGAEWIFPDAIEDSKIRDDLYRLLSDEGRSAIITSDLDTRAMVANAGKRGTFLGEVVRSAFIFKSFPLTMMAIHHRAMMREQKTLFNRVGYGLNVLLLTTIGGALSQQLWNLSQGRDPEDMTSKGFWGRAALKGGGWGIWGDLIKSSENRYGGGVAKTIVGPFLGQTVGSVAGMLTDNTVAALDGDLETETQWAKDAVNLARSETPGLSLWYTRLAMERLFIDRIREASGEDMAAVYRRAEEKAKESGTGYWAGPGALTGLGAPVRAPDLGNAFGKADQRPAQ